MYDQRSSSDFKNEVLTLSQIEHLNLVRLYGYLEHGDERVMVVEYVGNGTLREHLHGESCTFFALSIWNMLIPLSIKSRSFGSINKRK